MLYCKTWTFVPLCVSKVISNKKGNIPPLWIQTGSYFLWASCIRLSHWKVTWKPPLLDELTSSGQRKRAPTILASTREIENSWPGLWPPCFLKRLTWVSDETMGLSTHSACHVETVPICQVDSVSIFLMPFCPNVMQGLYQWIMLNLYPYLKIICVPMSCRDCIHVSC